MRNRDKAHILCKSLTSCSISIPQCRCIIENDALRADVEAARCSTKSSLHRNLIQHHTRTECFLDQQRVVFFVTIRYFTGHLLRFGHQQKFLNALHRNVRFGHRSSRNGPEIQHRQIQWAKIRCHDEDLFGSERTAEIHVTRQTEENGRSWYDVETKQNTTQMKNATNGNQFLPVIQMCIFSFIGHWLLLALRQWRSILAHQIDHAGEWMFPRIHFDNLYALNDLVHHTNSLSSAFRIFQTIRSSRFCYVHYNKSKIIRRRKKRRNIGQFVCYQ